MRSALGLLLVSLAAHAAAEPVAPPAPQAVAAPVAPAPVPDVAPPAPVPVQQAAEPAPSAPVRRLRLPQAAWAPLISEPPVFEDESAVTPETLQWRDWLEAKKERRIERNDEIGGIAAIGVRLGNRSQADSIEGLSAEQVAALASWNDDGALVLSVVPGSPADQAGIVPGDVIVQFAGIWVDSMGVFVRLASRAEVGREQPLLVLRSGQAETVYVTPIDRKELGR